MSEGADRVYLSENVHEEIHEYKRSSSSSSDSDKDDPSLCKARKKHLFGRKEPLHALLGGGKSADIILWRNKHLSSAILAGVTLIWLLFEWVGYHLLTFICHSLILFLAALFLWSNAASFLNRNPPEFPEIILSEELFLTIAHAVKYQINEAFASFHFFASGKDLKTFVMVIGSLWILSIISSWFSFLTLFYIVFVATNVAPALYEKYEDDVDSAAEKAMFLIKSQYSALSKYILQKIPGGYSFSNNKKEC
ncbi:Reticulon-like protein B5 [Platanthera guangdongensis]|uniref:Reticulon-like protein n=1 Tax=Platanthera guangdongensis TaxID=2320717 RepID=A0ABR2MBZ2_9ASPA